MAHHTKNPSWTGGEHTTLRWSSEPSTTNDDAALMDEFDMFAHLAAAMLRAETALVRNHRCIHCSEPMPTGIAGEVERFCDALDDGNHSGFCVRGDRRSEGMLHAANLLEAALLHDLFAAESGLGVELLFATAPSQGGARDEPVKRPICGALNENGYTVCDLDPHGADTDHMATTTLEWSVDRRGR